MFLAKLFRKRKAVICAACGRTIAPGERRRGNGTPITGAAGRHARCPVWPHGRRLRPATGLYRSARSTPRVNSAYETRAGGEVDAYAAAPVPGDHCRPAVERLELRLDRRQRPICQGRIFERTASTRSSCAWMAAVRLNCISSADRTSSKSCSCRSNRSSTGSTTGFSNGSSCSGGIGARALFRLVGTSAAYRLTPEPT